MTKAKDLYADFNALISEGERPEFYSAGYTPESYVRDVSLSERLLFTQSNARVLLGQDTMGRLHFLSAPNNFDYPIPTSRIGSNVHIRAHHGMYCQADMALFLGKMRYTFESSDGQIMPCAVEGSITRYLDHYLPLTETSHNGLEMAVSSIAPVLEPDTAAALAPLPLPGPSGAIYALWLKNTGKETLTGTVHLNLDENFMIQYEHSGKLAEERSYPPYNREVDNGLLTLWRPDACAGLQMIGGTWRNESGAYYSTMPVALAPGEGITIETYVAVSSKVEGIRPALAVLYQHSILDWINFTSAFWKDRFGDLKASAHDCPEIVRESVEFHIRNMLDNFNCLQADYDGRLLIHWQGAPSHNFGRMWGIDVEPTAGSIMHILPQLGMKVIEYMVERNMPRYTPYHDHSTPIYISPLILAGKYLEYTGDVEYFKENTYTTTKLEEIYNGLLACKHEKAALFSSRFSSDGLVMRKYDHGTNAKAYYALKAWGRILQALGRPAGHVEELMAQMRKDISLMIADGPFGKQISGGVNLGEQGDFYMKDDLLYYDGEDSASCMAPVYGIYGYDYAPWQTYHLFAKSMFCTNYDPEMETIRWFPYGAALDGTAYISQVGGALTRPEMAEAMKSMFEKSVDDTGSLYWWPLGKNWRRRISRCSQGQGAWVWQYIQQWLGITLDGQANSLLFAPLGLPTEFSWKNAVFGSFRFDFNYREDGGTVQASITNHSEVPLTATIRLRQNGSGCEGPGEIEITQQIHPGDTLSANEVVSIKKPEPVSIVMREGELLGTEGVAFGHFGYMLPTYETAPNNVFMLRYVVINGSDMPLENVSVALKLPEGMRAHVKSVCHWDGEETLENGLKRGTVKSPAATVQPGTRQVFPFWVELCDSGWNRSNVWLSGCTFTYPSENTEPKLLIESAEPAQPTSLSAEFSCDNTGSRTCTTPVVFMPAEEIRAKAVEIFGALNP